MRPDPTGRVRRPLSTLLAVTLLAAAPLVPGTGAVAAPARHAAAPAGVVAHLFEWKWTDVQRECTQVLGPAGYAAVQISPPQENIVLPQQGYPWWQRYQAISYRLDSRSGTRAQLAAMVRGCHQAGVKVYADALINHTAGTWPAGTRGAAGSTFSHYDYPGIYTSNNFHHCGRNGNDDIVNYQDAWEVQNCELVDLADLATEQPYVRDRIAGYLNDLLSLGVDGFRFDAAKHVPEADIAAIEAKLRRPAYIYQEVTYGAGEPIQPNQYEPTGRLLEFRYGTAIGTAFKAGGKLADLRGLGTDPSWEPSGKALVFTDNHDTQRSGAANILTFADGQLYNLANTFELAWPYGTPVIMSSIAFTPATKDAGPPSDATGHTKDVDCGHGWVCEHRRPVITGMVGFRNAVGTAPVVDWWTDGGNQIAFGRGPAGYLVVNRGSTPLTRTFQTRLAPGRYCDVTHGQAKNGRCTGPTVTVDRNGRFTATVAALDTLAIHHLARV